MKEENRGEKDENGLTIERRFGAIIRRKWPILSNVIQQNCGFDNPSVSDESLENDETVNKVTESTLLKDVIAVERNSLFTGALTGSIVFAGIRYLPRKFVDKFGSDKHRLKILESDTLRRSNFRGRVGLGNSLLLEVSLGLFIGRLAYSSQLERMEEADKDKRSNLTKLSQIPLVNGESVIADELCTDWITEHAQIDPDVWKYHKNKPINAAEIGGNHDLRQAINSFAMNCLERRRR